jgi:lysophospholipase L1-like esterase
VTIRAAAVLAALGLVAGAAAGQTHYLAFGDSITYGVADDPTRVELGYPLRLEALLNAEGSPDIVDNHGQPAETTSEGLSRITFVLQGGGDVLLLMEGTNDITRRVSIETIVGNLNEMARRAGTVGIETVHLTVVPRRPTANFDGDNRVTATLAAAVRDLAFQQTRDLADPFEVFITTPNVFEDYYAADPADKLHPGPRGYDLLAETVFKVLAGIDEVPPVPGVVSPADGATDVPADVELAVDLYDFGEEINLARTAMLVNGAPVEATLRGNNRKLELRFRPTTPLRGVVRLGVRSQDLATPPNTIERTLSRFTILGTVLLDGDLDQDGRVDGADLVLFAVRFGSVRGDSRYRANADLNHDDRVDGADLAILAANFGRTSF